MRLTNAGIVAHDQLARSACDRTRCRHRCTGLRSGNAGRACHHHRSRRDDANHPREYRGEPTHSTSTSQERTNKNAKRSELSFPVLTARVCFCSPSAADEFSAPSWNGALDFRSELMQQTSHMHASNHFLACISHMSTCTCTCSTVLAGCIRRDPGFGCRLQVSRHFACATPLMLLACDSGESSRCSRQRSMRMTDTIVHSMDAAWLLLDTIKALSDEVRCRVAQQQQPQQQHETDSWFCCSCRSL